MLAKKGDEWTAGKVPSGALWGGEDNSGSFCFSGVAEANVCRISVLQESQVTKLPSSYLQPRKNDDQNDNSLFLKGPQLVMAFRRNTKHQARNVEVDEVLGIFCEVDG